MIIWEGAGKDHGLHARSRAKDQEWVATHESVYFQRYAIYFVILDL
jgi:hypothetical protein